MTPVRLPAGLLWAVSPDRPAPRRDAPATATELSSRIACRLMSRSPEASTARGRTAGSAGIMRMSTSAKPLGYRIGGIRSTSLVSRSPGAVPELRLLTLSGASRDCSARRTRSVRASSAAHRWGSTQVPCLLRMGERAREKASEIRHRLHFRSRPALRFLPRTCLAAWQSAVRAPAQNSRCRLDLAKNRKVLWNSGVSLAAQHDAPNQRRQAQEF
jgi:hypothetical protein